MKLTERQRRAVALVREQGGIAEIRTGLRGWLFKEGATVVVMPRATLTALRDKGLLVRADAAGSPDGAPLWRLTEASGVGGA